MTLDRIQSTAAAPYLDVFADALTKAGYKRAAIQRYLGAAAHPKSRVVARIIMRSGKMASDHEFSACDRPTPRNNKQR
jgi:hypothetical protein